MLELHLQQLDEVRNYSYGPAILGSEPFIAPPPIRLATPTPSLDGLW